MAARCSSADLRICVPTVRDGGLAMPTISQTYHGTYTEGQSGRTLVDAAGHPCYSGSSVERKIVLQDGNTCTPF